MEHKRRFPLSPQEFESIYSRVPRVTVDLVIQNTEGILLTFRTAEVYKNVWHLPGGTVYLGEELSDAVKRIAKEELEIEVEIIRFIDIMQYLNEQKDRGFGHAVSPTYLCRPLSFDIKLDETASDFKFFREVPDAMIPEQKEFLIKHRLLSS